MFLRVRHCTSFHLPLFIIYRPLLTLKCTHQLHMNLDRTPSSSAMQNSAKPATSTTTSRSASVRSASPAGRGGLFPSPIATPASQSCNSSPRADPSPSLHTQALKRVQGDFDLLTDQEVIEHGVGMRIEQRGHGIMYVAALLKGGSAQRCGKIRPHDELIQIDDYEIQIGDPVEMIRGLVLGKVEILKMRISSQNCQQVQWLCHRRLTD